MSGYEFEGWMGFDKEAVHGKMAWENYTPKTWEETDIDIKITHCGICASDLHTLRSGWGPTNYPCVVGHEVVGVAVRVGSKAEGNVRIGDRVGVGAQSDTCLGRFGDCEECASGKENYCSVRVVQTYNDQYFSGDTSYGGYSKYLRCPSHNVFKIPSALSSAEAAPMLCAGITTYSPLKKNGCGPGKRVGIIGIGGLGHFGILWAKAFGADYIVAMSRRADKKADALELGADEYIATSEDKDWAKAYTRSLDLIVSTVSSSQIPINEYLGLLKTEGQFIQVGVPEGEGVTFQPFVIIAKGAKIAGSGIGSPSEIRDMLQFAADQAIHPWIVERPMEEANAAIVDMAAGEARYRYVLVNKEQDI